MYEGKYATREDIYAARMMGCGYPMGPRALADLVGVDAIFAVLETMYEQSGERLHAPTSATPPGGTRPHAGWPRTERAAHNLQLALAERI